MKPYQLGLYEKSMPNELSIPEKLALAGQLGYDYLELSIDETDEKIVRLGMSPDDIAAISAAVVKTGIPIGSICLSAQRRYPLGSEDASTEQKSIDILTKAIDLAALLGIPIVQIAGYDVYYEPSTAHTVVRFENNLRHCVYHAASRGVMLGFETMETEFLDTVGKAMAFVSRIQSPYLGVYPDVGNLTNAALLYGGNVSQDLRLGAGHIMAVHLKETKPGVYREVPYSTGHVNFAEAIATAYQMGIRRYVTELWCTDASTWKDSIRFANRFARQFLDAQP